MKSALETAQSVTKTASAVVRTSTLVLGVPFDLAREQYAHAVRVGLIERSMLGWAKFDRTVSRLEKLVLGPRARQV